MAAVLIRRRTVGFLAAVALALGGCGGEDGGDASPGVGVGASTTTESQAVRPGATSTTRRSGAPTPTTRKSGSPAPNSGGGSTTANADDGDLRAAAKSGPGLFAGMLLAPSPADALVVDLLVEQGAQVDEAAIAAVRQTLASASGKPVNVRAPVAVDLAGDLHSAEEIRTLADAAGRAQGNGSGVVHVLYLNGAFTDDSALGVSVRGDTFAVFPDQLDAVASPLVSRARLERAVLTHELGHLLGLVDLYLQTGRDDAEHPGHSRNSRSVMYWAVESDLVGQVLGGPPPVDFDADDQADLRKIHDGARAG